MGFFKDTCQVCGETLTFDSKEERKAWKSSPFDNSYLFCDGCEMVSEHSPIIYLWVCRVAHNTWRKAVNIA